MPIKVGLDTSFVIGLLDEQGIWHSQAKVITWLYPDLPSMFDSVTALVERSGGELNFNDALIAISCEQRGIPYLVSFDSDFDRVDTLIRIGSPDDLPAP